MVGGIAGGGEGTGSWVDDAVCGLHSKKKGWSWSMVTAAVVVVEGGRGVRWDRVVVVVRTGRGGLVGEMGRGG